MKNAFKILALVAMIGMTATAMAADTTQPSKKAMLRGKVEKIDGTKITIMSRNGEVVIDTDDNTKFFLDKKPATLADVKENERLTATPDTGVATEVHLTSARGKKATATSAPSN